MPRTDPTRITVVVHPPERGRARSLAPAQAGASCCCCCCCLHSLGAIIGAGIAPAFGQRSGPRTQEEEDYVDFADAEAPVRRHGPSAVGLFWLSTLALGLLVVIGGGVLTAANGNGEFAGGMLVGGFAILMLMPALLLLAAAVAALILAVSGRPDKLFELRRLGRITLFMVIGTIIGIVPMGCVLLVLMNK